MSSLVNSHKNDRACVTLGPKSKCVLIEKKWGRPIVCNDGVTIAKEFELEDHEENLGAQVIRQAAERTGELGGPSSPGFRKVCRNPVVLMRCYSPFWSSSHSEEMATRLRCGNHDVPGDRFSEIEMIDRQKVESILRKRFQSANWAVVAAAANAIMGLGDEWLEIECRDPTCVSRELEAGAEIRVFRRVVHEEAR